jgi:murein DD-endopeptidase MepM/ murein hydrolase activator NlpD
MPASVVSFRARISARAAAIAIAAIGLAACSNSGRFEIDDPFNPPSASRSSPEVTGSVSHRAPTSQISRAPLPAPSRPQTVASGGVSQGAGGLGTYRPVQPQTRSQDITGSVATPVAGHWTWEGGTPVVVGSEDNVEAIGRKYGVPASAIMQANNISDPSSIRPGQRLVIPRYVSSATASRPQPAPAHVAAAPAAHPAPVVAPPQSAPAGDNVHVVAAGETLMAISRKYKVSLSSLAKANNIKPFTKVAIGDRITVPGRHIAPVKQIAAAPQAAKPPVAQQQPQHVAQKPVQPETRVASAMPTAPVATVPATENARVATEGPVHQDNAAKAEPTGAMPSFRWPVHGRIISAFGSRAAGAQNDGINLAVPEGTPVKAAEDGVVAYAGNELKGYGNLVLVRHSNGYVSAYANASELMVKRGDSVKRGETIARAGQTGNVSSPQLHFEIRKGSTPVDPTKYLSGGNNG